MAPAKPKSKSNKRKKSPHRSQHCEPDLQFLCPVTNSDDDMPLPPPGAPIVDYFDVEHGSSKLKATPRRPHRLQPSTSREYAWTSAIMMEAHQAQTSSIRQPPLVKMAIPHRMVMTAAPPPNPATVQDGRDDSDGHSGGLGNSNSIGPPHEAQTPINSPARKKRHPNLLAKTLLVQGSMVASGSSDPTYSASDQKQVRTGLQATPRKPSPSRMLLLPFTQKPLPSRYVYFDDPDSDEEGTFAALVRLAAASPAATPSTSVPPAANPAAAIIISDNESPTPASSATTNNGKTIVIVISDDESPTPASSATTNNGKTISNFVINISDDESAIASHSPLILASDSESEYLVSDIELTDELIAQLDHPVAMRRSSPIVISD